MAGPLELSAAWTSRGDSRILGAHACTGPTPGHILVTTSDQVALLNTSKSTFQGTAAVVHSWEYRAGSATALSVLAVQHPTKHDLFYGVRGKGKADFVTWSSSTERLSEVPARSLAFEVHALLVNTHLDGCVAVGATGAVSIVTDASIVSLVPASKPASTVEFAHLSNDSSHQLHLTLLFKSSGSNYTAASYVLAQDHGDVTSVSIASTGPRHVVSPPTASSSLVSTLAQDAHKLSLFWSTGEWQSLALLNTATELKPVATLTVAAPSTGAVATSTSDEVAKKKRKVAAASSASATYFAAAVSSKSVVVGSSSSLAVWNSQYAVEMSSHSLTSPASGLLALVVLPQTSHIAYISERSVQVAVVPTAPATLASVLGKGAAHHAAPLVLSTFDAANPAEVTAVMSSLDLANWQSTLLGDNAAQLDVLRQLTTPTLTPTQDAFKKVFYGYVYFKAKRKLRVGVLSPQFVVQVATRIVASPELALWPELSLLLATKHLCSRSIPSLVPTMMALKQFAVLEDCLLHLSDVDEVLAIRICKFVLREASAASVAAFQTQHAKAATTGVTTPSQFVEHFLSLVVALPKADVFLQNAMQAFTVPEVLALLACLKKWYRQRAAPESLHHIVEWMGLLLDVHYTALVVESDTSPYIVTVLHDLQKLLLTHVDACHHMADIHGELDQFLASAHLPQTAASLPDYAVDVLLL